MATKTAQPEPPQRPPQNNPLIDNVALVFAIGTPLIMLMPPRKMDLRFFALAATFSLSTNHLCKSYTGESIYSRFNNRVSAAFDNGLPEGAQRTQRLLREHREREAAANGLPLPGQEKPSAPNILKDIWMGGEKEDWKEKRAEEHQRSFEEGKGMSDIILEQIADVFSGNWGSTKKQDTEATKQDDSAKTGSETLLSVKESDCCHASRHMA